MDAKRSPNPYTNSEVYMMVECIDRPGRGVTYADRLLSSMNYREAMWLTKICGVTLPLGSEAREDMDMFLFIARAKRIARNN